MRHESEQLERRWLRTPQAAEAIGVTSRALNGWIERGALSPLALSGPQLWKLFSMRDLAALCLVPELGRHGVRVRQAASIGHSFFSPERIDFRDRGGMSEIAFFASVYPTGIWRSGDGTAPSISTASTPTARCRPSRVSFTSAPAASSPPASTAPWRWRSARIAACRGAGARRAPSDRTRILAPRMVAAGSELPYSAARNTAIGAPMSVDADTVRRAAKLARIAVKEEALEPMAKELSNILAWIEQLQEVDVENVEPMTSVTPMRLKRRKDAITAGGEPEKILGVAPRSQEGFYVVPKVVE